MRWLPDALTYMRGTLTFATYPVAYWGWKPLFAVLVLLIVITDILDGPIARRLRITNARGANMDSAADFLFYASLPVWTYWFRPDVVRDLLPFVVVFFIGYLAANVASRVRRGVIGFHNRYTRSAGTIGVVFALWTVLWGFNPFLAGMILTILVLDLVQRGVNLYRARPERPEARVAPAPARPAGRKE